MPLGYSALISPGDRVNILQGPAKGTSGTVRAVFDLLKKRSGRIDANPGETNEWIGVELDAARGENDGFFGEVSFSHLPGFRAASESSLRRCGQDGEYHFHCAPGHGLYLLQGTGHLEVTLPQPNFSTEYCRGS